MRFIGKSALAAVLMATFVASAGAKQSSEILIFTKEGTVSSAEKAVKGMGRVVGIDTKSGLYRVALNSGDDTKSIKRRMVLSGKVTVAINADQARYDLRNDESVSEHLTYVSYATKHQATVSGK